jgi:hypothetical protein
MRKAALQKQQLQPSIPSNCSWVKRQYISISSAVLDLVQRPSYTIPLILNLSGSVVFFLIVGQAGPLFTSNTDELSVRAFPNLSQS